MRLTYLTSASVSTKSRRCKKFLENKATVPEEDSSEWIYAHMDCMDDVHGGAGQKDGHKGTKKENELVQNMGVYTVVKREAWMKVRSTKWIDTRAMPTSPDYTTRLAQGQSQLKRVTTSSAHHRLWKVCATSCRVVRRISCP